MFNMSLLWEPTHAQERPRGSNTLRGSQGRAFLASHVMRARSELSVLRAEGRKGGVPVLTAVVWLNDDKHGAFRLGSLY